MDGYTPADYMKFLTPHDPDGPASQPHADFWRKAAKGTTNWVTPPIIRDSGVKKLARLFGVQVDKVEWVERNAAGTAVTCEVTVSGYTPLPAEQAQVLLTRKVDFAQYPLATDYPVPKSTTQIGEVNLGNAGMTGAKYPQIFAYKRAYDRAVLDHLGLYDCYGDVEAPQFAQDADFEAERDQPAGAPVVRVSGKQWGALPAEPRRLARSLMHDRGVAKATLDMLYLDCDGDPDAVLQGLQDVAANLDKKETT